MSKETFPICLADALTETEKRLSKTKETDSERAGLLLKCACLHFHLGHTRKCQELLKQIYFSSFDFKEWIVENNLLICQLKGPSGFAAGMCRNVLKSFDKLLEKVQGLPQDSSIADLELLVAHNYSYLLFSAANDPASSSFAADGHHKSACVLVTTLLRVISSFNRKADVCEQISHACIADVFTDVVCNRVLGSIDTLFKTAAGLLATILSSFCHCCCLLSIVWMSAEQVDKAKHLLQKIHDHLQKLKETPLRDPFTQLWSLGGLSVTFVPASISSPCLYTLSEDSFVGPGQSGHLAMLVKLLLAFCHYCSGETTQALDLTDSEGFSGQLLLHSLFIKGVINPFIRRFIMQMLVLAHLEKVRLFLALSLIISNTFFSFLFFFTFLGSILYDKDDITGALSSFCQCLTLSKEYGNNSRHTAAVNHMIGCCCARKLRPHTAIAKFREAFECDMTQVSALYNISLQYRQLGDGDAEIQTLKFLLQALHLKNTPDGSHDKRAHSPFLYPAFQQKPALPLCEGGLARVVLCSALPDEGLTVEYVTWVLANRCNKLKRFSEAAEAFLDILTVLVEKPTAALVLGSARLPSPSTIYCECASSLLNAGRFDDTVIICDKALEAVLLTQGERTKNATTLTRIEPRTEERDAVSEDSPHQVKSTVKRSREHDSEDDSPTENRFFSNMEASMLLTLKSDALIQLDRPLEATHCLNRVLRLLECVPSCGFTEIAKQPDSEEQQRKKKRKLLSGQADSDSGSAQTGTDCVHPSLKRLIKLKAQVYNNKGLILIGMDQPHEALQELHWSLECWPGNMEAVFNHTLLLKRLGKHREAAYNWLTFRGLDSDEIRQGPVKQKLPERSSSCSRLSISQVSKLDKSCLDFWNDKTTCPR